MSKKTSLAVPIFILALFELSSGHNSTPSATSALGNGEGIILPKVPKCGQADIRDWIYGGEDIRLDEFPWIVLLEYVKDDETRSFGCIGSLINQRYVLTAAQCLTGVTKLFGRLDRVRLGEYDLTKAIDCIKTDCADPIVNIGVEEAIPHPEYDDSSKNRQNDIALVRLNDVVVYSDFIKPVCLPTAIKQQRELRLGSNLIAAGWGRTLTGRQSNVKQKVSLPFYSFKECSEKFKTKGVELTSTQLCAGGRYGEDTCNGDAGGPLVSGEGGAHFAIEGITSFGNGCGLEGWPSVFTKVADFEAWIKTTLRP